MNIRIPAPAVAKYEPKVYQCFRTREPHQLDGNIDKPFWSHAPFTEEFEDIEGAAKPAPRFKTQAKILWDDHAVYFGAVLWGDEIWGHITERDEVIFRDNDFEIFIDPDNDTHVYCEFEMNVLNTIWDLLLTKPYRDKGIPINSFDYKGIKTAVKVEGEVNKPGAHNKRWMLEVVIPFTSLLECSGQGTEIPKAGDFWRINFSRVQWKVDVQDGAYRKQLDEAGNPLPEDNWVWSPMGIVNMHYPELWGYLFFCGREDERYCIPKEEYIKWEMRKLYYQLHEAYDKTGKFSAEGLENPIGAAIHVMDRGFEIIAGTENGDELVLYSDSKIEKQSRG